MKSVNLEQIVHGVAIPDERIKDAVFILDSSYIADMPKVDGKYQFSLESESGERYKVVLTSGVKEEISKPYQVQGGEKKLFPRQLKGFVIDYLKPEQVDYQPTPQERQVISYGVKDACSKTQRISEADVQQLAYAMNLQKDGTPVIMFTKDKHITETANWLRDHNYKIYS